MYVQTLHIYNLRCFIKQVIPLCYPNSAAKKELPLQNVTVLVGDNGAGKTTILKACALATLSPVLIQSGLVPYHLVRRPLPRQASVKKPYEALVKANTVLHEQDVGKKTAAGDHEDLLAKLRPRGKSNFDILQTTRVPKPRITDIYDDNSPSFFAVGYGATRRVEAGDEDSGSRSKRRTLRYQRVAGLFEDHVALRPLERWLPQLRRSSRFKEVANMLNSLLPKAVHFDGKYREGEFYFSLNGTDVPFAALSDGYRAFVGWVGDLLGHMADCCPKKQQLRDLTGLVLVDEIDLHLHPEWQRHVVPNLCRVFPNLQFILSTHSPIVAGTLTSQNLRVMETEDDGSTTVKQYSERIHGLGADQVLTSSYFDMKTTRAPDFENELDKLARDAADGDGHAAIAYIQRLAGAQPEEVAESRSQRIKAVRRKRATKPKRDPKMK